MRDLFGVRADGLFEDRKRTGQQRFSLLRLAPIGKERSEIAQALGNLGMIGTVGLFFERERAPEQRLRSAVVPPGPVDVGERGEAEAQSIGIAALLGRF